MTDEEREMLHDVLTLRGYTREGTRRIDGNPYLLADVMSTYTHPVLPSLVFVHSVSLDYLLSLPAFQQGATHD